MMRRKFLWFVGPKIFGLVDHLPIFYDLYRSCCQYTQYSVPDYAAEVVIITPNFFLFIPFTKSLLSFLFTSSSSLFFFHSIHEFLENDLFSRSSYSYFRYRRPLPILLSHLNRSQGFDTLNNNSYHNRTMISVLPVILLQEPEDYPE